MSKTTLMPTETKSPAKVQYKIISDEHFLLGKATFDKRKLFGNKLKLKVKATKASQSREKTETKYSPENLSDFMLLFHSISTSC